MDNPKLKTKLALSVAQKVADDVDCDDIEKQIRDLQEGEANLFFYDCHDGTHLGVYVFRMSAEESDLIADNYAKHLDREEGRVGLGLYYE